MSKPTVTKKIPVAKPFFSDLELQLVQEAVQSGWVAQGPKVKAFEKAVAEYVGVECSIATNSCTSALMVGLEVLGIGPGDEVIVPSFTFIATANAVVHRGATPVFVDIDPLTYNLNPDLIERAITDRTKAILPVDQVGVPADMNAINAIAAKHKLRVLEDAACAIGSEYHGKKVGACAEISCLSFHPRKVITAGEGGMILTKDSDLAEKARLLVSHGASVSDLARHRMNQVVFEEYPVFGYNYRMSDLQAAVGLGQLSRLDEILAKKRYFAERYNRVFAEVQELTPPVEPAETRVNYQSYLLRISPSAKLSRDEIMQELLEKGISTRRGIMAIHLEPAYRNRFGTVSLPETERALQETLIMPLYAQMSEEDQDDVMESLKTLLVHGKVSV